MLCRTSRKRKLIANIWRAWLQIWSETHLSWRRLDLLRGRFEITVQITSASLLCFVAILILRLFWRVIYVYSNLQSPCTCMCAWVCVCVCAFVHVAALSLPHSSHVTGQTLLSGEPFIGWLQMCLSSSPIIQREIGIVTLWGLIQDKIEKWR